MPVGGIVMAGGFVVPDGLSAMVYGSPDMRDKRAAVADGGTNDDYTYDRRFIKQRASYS